MGSRPQRAGGVPSTLRLPQLTLGRAAAAGAGMFLMALVWEHVPMVAAAPRCVDDTGWHVCYESTATDGLRVSNVTYQGTPVLVSGSLPQIDVAYTGFTLLDELGTAMIPEVGGTEVRRITGGFEVVQTYQMAAWPRCGSYRYDQSWRFYSDGRLEPFVTTFGPGVEGPHTYRTYWRLEVASGSQGAGSFETWSGAWQRPAREGLFSTEPPNAPDGTKWRVLDDGAGWSLSSPANADGSRGWALRKTPGQGEIDLPAQRRAGFPDQWVNEEAIQGQALVLWYELSVYKGTNCDEAMRVGSGPVLAPVQAAPATSPPPPGPSPTSTGTAAPPTAMPATPTVALPSPGPTVPGATTVRGRVELQGRATFEGVVVTLDGTARAITSADGAFEILGVPPGDHTLGADIAGYLCVAGEIAVSAAEPLDVPPVTLRGGDIVRDGLVNILDLAAVGAEYGNAAPGGSRADINLDGSVGLFDLVMVSSGYGLTCPLEWLGEEP